MQKDEPKKATPKKKPATKKAPAKKTPAKKAPVKKTAKKAPPRQKPAAKRPTAMKPKPKKWTYSDFHCVMDNIMTLSRALARLESVRIGSHGGAPEFGNGSLGGICSHIRESLDMQLYALDVLTKEFLPYKTEREKITDIIESNSVKDITQQVDAELAASAIPAGMPVGPAVLRTVPSAQPIPIPGLTTS